jgi:glycosidase
MLCEKYKNFLDMVVYQVYPKSFKDTNGDGIGDLNGITEKIPYLKNLGVNAVWISPCYKTMNDDGGYDIYDYRDIDDVFGTLDDWKRMIKVMHENGIKLIMDYVANHTSTNHKWFKEARTSRDNPYHDYYIWSETIPNDWQSCFGGSAWEWNEATKEYYLHSFYVSQADLNWDNPQVRKELIDVIDYWVDLGVDGFRCDVLDMISKELPYKNGRGKNLHKYINMIFGREKVKHLFTVGECWSSDVDEMYQYGAAENGELSTTFQFSIFDIGRKSRFDPVPYEHDELHKVFSKWETALNGRDLLYSLVLENHDQSRCVNNFGDAVNYRYESATMLATMVYSLRGIPFIYQGQEIGQTNAHFENVSDFDDVETLGFYKIAKDKMPQEKIIELMNFNSRDNARHPMAWDGTETGGFTTGKPWLPFYNTVKEINVESDLKSEKSVYKYYQQYLKFRMSNDVMKYGDFEDLTLDHKNYFIYKRTYEGKSYIVICNYKENSEIEYDFTKLKKVIGNYKDDNGNMFRPFECGVYEVQD